MVFRFRKRNEIKDIRKIRYQQIKQSFDNTTIFGIADSDLFLLSNLTLKETNVYRELFFVEHVNQTKYIWENKELIYKFMLLEEQERKRDLLRKIIKVLGETKSYEEFCEKIDSYIYMQANDACFDFIKLKNIIANTTVEE